MEEKIIKFKEHVIKESANPDFVHHQWFIKWHLKIVECLVNELCDIYTEADRNICLLLVWLHDYGKILAQTPENFSNGSALTISEGRRKLSELGFADAIIDKSLDYYQLMERKMTEDLSKAPIEVQIISSADAASHMIGPFMFLYWYENPNKSLDELLLSNVKKAQKDWKYKITLPEVKERFQDRYNYFTECQELPSAKFL